MRHLIKLTLFAFVFLSLLFGSCRQLLPVKIKRDKKTEIKSDPISIQESEYQYLIDSLNLFGVYEIPYYYGGLNPQYPIAYSYKSLNYDEEPNGFQISGGMMFLAENPIIVVDGQYVVLDSKEKFQTTFAPIENEEEALAYVCAYTGTYPQYEFDLPFRYRKYMRILPQSYAEKTESGYLVVSYDYDVFGCGPHTHWYVESFVDFDGNVKELDRKKAYEDPFEDGLCVD